MKMRLSKEARRRLGLLALLALLFACGASTQAPIRDQSRTLPNRQPEIVSGDGPVVFQPPGGSASAGRPDVYRVREGDTLYAIAFMYGIDYRELAAGNSLAPPYTIYVGQQLKLTAQGEGAPAAASAAAPGGDIRRRPIGQDAAAPPAPVAAGERSAPNSVGWQWPLADRGATSYRPDINNRLDIEGKAGDSVLAAKGGEVVYSRPFGDDAGNLLIIRHDDRFLSAYTQTGRVLVETGDRVAAGQAIVELESVESGSPMLYFNVQRDGAFVDPTRLLPRASP